MWSFMESTKPGVFAQGNAEGLERVKKGNGKYAFLMESTTIEYVIERECDTTQIGGLLDSKGYGIALPPGMYSYVHMKPPLSMFMKGIEVTLTGQNSPLKCCYPLEILNKF